VCIVPYLDGWHNKAEHFTAFLWPACYTDEAYQSNNTEIVK
jgi:hypothetical protein